MIDQFCMGASRLKNLEKFLAIYFASSHFLRSSWVVIGTTKCISYFGKQRRSVSFLIIFVITRIRLFEGSMIRNIWGSCVFKCLKTVCLSDRSHWIRAAGDVSSKISQPIFFRKSHSPQLLQQRVHIFAECNFRSENHKYGNLCILLLKSPWWVTTLLHNSSINIILWNPGIHSA